MTPIYLVSILCGQDSFEQNILSMQPFGEVQCVDMAINIDKVREFLAEDGLKEMCPQACTI